MSIKFLLSTLLMGCILTYSAYSQDLSTNSGYNILFIAIDDLNDFVGAFGGHPQGSTPNIDRLASEGMKFMNAHCAASLCKPSRTALMSGFRPSTSGVYGNSEVIRDLPVIANCLMIPEWLTMHGYFTTSRGKIYHSPQDEKDSWDEWVALSGSWGKPPEVPEGYNYNMLPADEAGNFDWGPTDVKREETPAYLTAKWVESLLNKAHDKPFFIAAGIFRPHLPWFVPQEYFDKFPLEDIILPEIKDDDMEDIPGQDPTALYNLTKSYGKRKEAVQAYLASANAADDAVGVMLDALAKSKFADNTVVILWGDHGWHLGEKLRYKKFTLWEEATRMPLVIKVPGMTTPGSATAIPVNLIDLYPTITELCKVPPNTNNEGISLVPLLKDPSIQREDLSLCTMGEENHTIRTNDWRLIQRGGEPQELYDHQTDPMEHNNLYSLNEYAAIRDKLKFQLDSILFRAPEHRKPLRANTIPGVIQAEKYDRGGEGVAYHDKDPENKGFAGSLVYYREKEGVDLYPCYDVGGGFYLGDIEKDEWVTYTIDSIEPGVYTIAFRLVSYYPGKILKASLNDTELFDVELGAPVTSGWEDVMKEGVTIDQSGPAILKLNFPGVSFLLNQITFFKTGEVSSGIAATQPDKYRIYPVPAENRLLISAFQQVNPFNVEIFDFEGNLCLSSWNLQKETEIALPENWSRGMYLVRVTDPTDVITRKVIIL